MNPSLRRAVESAISSQLGAPVTIGRTWSVGGGCINETEVVETAQGRFFVKSRAQAPPDFFKCERRGLELIARTGAIRVPQPVADSPGSEDFPPFLVLEHIESAPTADGHDEALARGLAGLHAVRGGAFGLDHDNHIGLTQQVNTPAESWPEFFATRRLEFQLRLMEEKSRATAELRTRLAKLVARLDDLIGGHKAMPSLLHGDLWSGNVMSDESGGPALVDPAVYHGDREADLAMTALFGAFGDAFYRAYDEILPLEDGHEDRKEIYNLYHLMNHVNLFGLSYLGGVLAILRRFT